MKDQSIFSNYSICKDSTITLVLQLCEGEVSPRVSLTSNIVSFKDAIRNKPSNYVALNYPLSSVYIVENFESAKDGGLKAGCQRVNFILQILFINMQIQWFMAFYFRICTNGFIQPRQNIVRFIFSLRVSLLLSFPFH
jgi:hypothetical protein